jgi:hypothetical protein
MTFINILKFEEIEQAKKDLPDHVFKELYLAEASDDGSNPFGDIRKYVKPISTNEVVCYGIDLAKSHDWTVIIGLDQQGNIAYFDRFQKPWQETTRIIIETVKNKKAAIDSTGVGDPIVEQVQRFCPNVESFKFTTQSKQQLMEGYAMRLSQGQTSILEGVHADEMESFEYEYTRTGVKYSAPAGLHDDTVSSGALATHKLYSSKFSGNYTIL